MGFICILFFVLRLGDCVMQSMPSVTMGVGDNGSWAMSFIPTCHACDSTAEGVNFDAVGATTVAAASEVADPEA